MSMDKGTLDKDGISIPPSGAFKVKNVYVEMVGDEPKFIFQWDDGEPA